jgi:L-ascorbate metabolism protein UlaG (beta-lactamase superfamily)
MNYFHQYNNATLVLNNEFIFDPWLYGSLYFNSWTPDKKTLKKSELKNIKYCFISHLHQDHWDLDTIKYFPKKTLFIIPDLKINSYMEYF